MSPSWIIFYVLISCICLQSQRVTLYTWSLTSTADFSGWIRVNQAGSYSGGFVTSSTCPSGSKCERFSNNDEFYRYFNTIGYKDIQIEYKLRTSGVDSGESCEVWWNYQVTTLSSSAGGTWSYIRSHVQNSSPITETITTLPSSVDNTANAGINFWANMGSGEYCYVNDVIVTGISISPIPAPTAPTPKPTTNHTPVPTDGPTVRPTDKPSSEATTGYPTEKPIAPRISTSITCGDTVNGDYNGVSITFQVNIPIDGDVTFHPNTANFQVTSVHVTTLSGDAVSSMMESDDNFVLRGVTAGDYLFIMDAGSQSGSFQISTMCTTNDDDEVSDTHSTAEPQAEAFTEREPITKPLTMQILVGVSFGLPIGICCVIAICLWYRRKISKEEREITDIIEPGEGAVARIDSPSNSMATGESMHNDTNPNTTAPSPLFIPPPVSSSMVQNMNRLNLMNQEMIFASNKMGTDYTQNGGETLCEMQPAKNIVKVGEDDMEFFDGDNDAEDEQAEELFDAGNNEEDAATTGTGGASASGGNKVSDLIKMFQN